MGSFSNQVMVDITFFCSPIGLGHAARDSAIVQHLKEIPIKFVTGDAAAKFLKQLEFNVEDVYIPPQFVIKNGLLQNSLRWLWKYYKYYKDCKGISSSIITNVLETRFTKGIGSIIERKMNRSMKDIMKKCDVIILPEEGIDEDNVRRVGPIVRTTNYSREELRKKFSFNKKTIVVSVGGTDAGKFLS